MLSLTQHLGFSRRLWVIVALGLFNCAAPEEPAGLQQASTPGSATKKEEKAADKTDQAKFNFGGAAVGDETTKSAVKECVDKGNFYERRTDQTVGCTTMKLAKIDCTDEGVKSAMSKVVRDIWVSKFECDPTATGCLKGFLVDQCLDCPTWDANETCKDFAEVGKGNEQKKAGFIIHLVKESGTVLTPRRVFNPKP
jgi:hypothetical protein